MDWTKNHRPRQTRRIVAAALAVLAVTAHAADWQTYTSFTDVRRMRLIDDTLFVATSGGLLAITDRDEPGQTYVNIDGLGTNDVTDIVVDATDQKWVTGRGRLVRFGGPNPRQFPTGPIYGDLRLLTVEDDGSNLWIGSDSGLILFSKENDGGQYQNRFRITSVNQFPAVYDIALDGDSIWLATAAGVAVANRSNPSQLVSPANWSVYNTVTHPALGNNRINRVGIFENQLYVGGFGGLFVMDTSGGTVMFGPIPVIGAVEVTDLIENNDSLFVYSSRGLVVVDDGGVTLLPGSFTSRPRTGFNTGDFRWVALDAGGLYHNAGGAYKAYQYVGMPENVVADVTVTPDGVVAALFDRKAMARLLNDEWAPTTFNVGLRTTKIRADFVGGIWAGTFGEGVYRVVGDTAIRYDQTNTPLHIDGNGDVVLSGVAVSDRHIFLSALNPVAGYPVVYCRLDSLDTRSAWDSIGQAQGLTDNTIISLAYQNGELAIGTDNNGVFVCRPFVSSVNCDHFTEDDNRLASDVVRIVRYAPDGALWVGTNFGLSRFNIELGLDLFETIPLPAGIGPDITSLAFDGRGNAWIGARNGLALYDVTDRSFTVFTSSNSGLVDNEIRGMSIDPVTGDLYIATNFGLSRYPSIFGPPTENIDEVIAFPNPFVIASSDDLLRFNFNRPGDVRIYTVAGDLVRTVRVNEGWDGRNDGGVDVASGVYLYIITDDEGNVGRGKVLLVRQ